MGTKDMAGRRAYDSALTAAAVAGAGDSRRLAHASRIAHPSQHPHQPHAMATGELLSNYSDSTEALVITTAVAGHGYGYG